jgi:hypothetical protein
MNNVKKSVLNKIENEHIKPIPKWQFVLRHIVLWAVVFITVILGGIAFSILFVNLYSIHWGYAPKIGGRFIFLLPYIWFLLVALTVYLASKAYENTKKGYKHKHWIIAMVTILISVLLGAILFQVKAGEKIERNLREFIPPYAKLQQIREKVWQAPEKGLLPGKIVKRNSAALIILDDLTGKKWKVDISDAKYHPLKKPRIGDDVIIAGKKTGESEFKAEGIKPRPYFEPRTKRAVKEIFK